MNAALIKEQDMICIHFDNFYNNTIKVFSLPFQLFPIQAGHLNTKHARFSAHRNFIDQLFFLRGKL